MSCPPLVGWRKSFDERIPDFPRYQILILCPTSGHIVAKTCWAYGPWGVEAISHALYERYPYTEVLQPLTQTVTAIVTDMVGRSEQPPCDLDPFAEHDLVEVMAPFHFDPGGAFLS